MQKEKEEEEKELEKLPRHFLIIQIVSAITGLVWCFITISILMDLLNCFIVIFGLNNTFMVFYNFFFYLFITNLI